MKKHIKTLSFNLMIATMSVLLSAGHLYAADNVPEIQAFSEERSAWI